MPLILLLRWLVVSRSIKRNIFKRSRLISRPWGLLKTKFLGLKEMLHDSIQRAMKVMLGVCDQVVEQAEKFYTTALVLVGGLNPFQAASVENPYGDLGTPVPGAFAWSFLFLFTCIIFQAIVSLDVTIKFIKVFLPQCSMHPLDFKFIIYLSLFLSLCCDFGCS